MDEKERIFAALALGFLTIALLISHSQGTSLTEENTKLKFMESRQQSIQNKIKPDLTTESEYIELAAKDYHVSKDLLWLMRNVERGAQGNEMGCHKVTKDIKRKYPVDAWQYVQAAEHLAIIQGQYAEANMAEFIPYLAQHYTGAEHVEKWIKQANKHWSKICK